MYSPVKIIVYDLFVRVYVPEVGCCILSSETDMMRPIYSLDGNVRTVWLFYKMMKYVSCDEFD